MRVAASYHLQRVVRGKRCRLVVHEKRRELRAALLVQCRWRGSRCKIMMLALRAVRERSQCCATLYFSLGSPQ